MQSAILTAVVTLVLVSQIDILKTSLTTQFSGVSCTVQSAAQCQRTAATDHAGARQNKPGKIVVAGF